MDLSLLFCLAGLASFIWRFKVWQRPFPTDLPAASNTHLATDPRDFAVSIVIPCRNEAQNLPQLVSSLRSLTGLDFEIVIVDDSSTDRTFEVATELLAGFPKCKVLRAPDKPPSWGGKNWPCWIGAEQAEGDVLLFTDADTIHAPSSLSESVRFLQKNGYDFVSAVPFHRCENMWERFFGLFFLLPLVATSFRDKPTASRVSAIGQYLLMTKESYFELGGHKKVASSLAEDIDLAVLYLNANRPYGVLNRPGLYQVQMYSSFQNFLKGWKRLLRLGLHRSTPMSVFEVSMICYLFGFSFLELRTDLLLVLAFALFTLLKTQQPYGKFSVLGVILAPLSVWLFVVLTAAAVFEKFLRKDIQWHGRSYSS